MSNINQNHVVFEFVKDGQHLGYAPVWGKFTRMYSLHEEHGVVSVPVVSGVEVRGVDNPPAWTLERPEDHVEDWSEDLGRYAVVDHYTDEVLYSSDYPGDTYTWMDEKRANGELEHPEDTWVEPDVT